MTEAMEAVALEAMVDPEVVQQTMRLPLRESHRERRRASACRWASAAAAASRRPTRREPRRGRSQRAYVHRPPRRASARRDGLQAAQAHRDGNADCALPGGETLDDFELDFQPSLDQRLVRELATSRFVANAENVLLFGPPGVGKSHLAIALGRAAVEHGHSALFITAASLLDALARAASDGQLNDKLAFFAKPKLLVIDELGYLPLEQRGAHLFFQLVTRRYERSSTFITTNQLVTQWGAVFADAVLAAAILDRLLHHSHTILVQGDSYLLKQKRKAGLVPNTAK